MAIKFTNLETKEKITIDADQGGRFYRSKLQAVVNSSDMSPNADRGQDFLWRLDPKQRAEIERWKKDSKVVEAVSEYTSVPVDSLQDGEFLDYMLYQQELEQQVEGGEKVDERDLKAAYEAEVKELAKQKKPAEAKKPAETKKEQ